MERARNYALSRKGAEHFDFTVPHGTMNTIFLPLTRFYIIDNLDVEPDHRRQGIGKLLLNEALSHATEIRADLIIAGIVSRECLQAMRDVFGHESIEVEDEGEFVSSLHPQPRMTSAALHHHLR